MPKTYIIANWKMHKTIEEAQNFFKEFSPPASSYEVLVAAPFTAIKSLAAVAKPPIVLGGQNMHDATEGAFTGEIAAEMLLDAGAKFVILGHSERRHLFGETSEFINKKVKRALESGLIPIVCVGETLAERKAGKSEEVVRTQIQETLEGISAKSAGKLVIAYEPVWAIGTGKTATPKDADKMHGVIRAWAKEAFGDKAVSELSIIYGGSVKPENAKELVSMPNVNGLLVGGGSLSPESFAEIVKNSGGA
jgi:triosephosphate isomerase